MTESHLRLDFNRRFFSFGEVRSDLKQHCFDFTRVLLSRYCNDLELAGPTPAVLVHKWAWRRPRGVREGACKHIQSLRVFSLEALSPLRAKRRRTPQTKHWILATSTDRGRSYFGVHAHICLKSRFQHSTNILCIHIRFQSILFCGFRWESRCHIVPYQVLHVARPQ